MRTRLSRAIALGGSLVTAAALAGCGSGIPADASVKDFCEAGHTFSGTTKFSEGVKAAERLRDTGTPKGIPDDARTGFELVVELVTEAEDQADLEKRYNDLSKSDKSAIDELDGYIEKTC